jgi:glutamyl-tRNA synthetase
MKISHVIRGEEWLPSLALHSLLYKAFNWECPEFAHLPLIMKPQGKGKLSKRDGEKFGFPIYPLTWGEALGYRESGYLSEAVINFLAMLGWNPGTDKEIFSMHELIQDFSLDRVHKSGARFDPEKIKWYNHHYLQKKPLPELAGMIRPVLQKHLRQGDIEEGEVPGLSYIEKAATLLRERVFLLTDFWDMGSFLFVRPGEFDEKAVKKHWKTSTPQLLIAIADKLETIPDFVPGEIEHQLKKWIEENNVTFGKVMAPLRLVLVGDLKGPHIFDIMGLLGKEECLARIRHALVAIPANP